MYFQTMDSMFHKIPVKIPKPFILKKKRKHLLHAIGGECYMNKLNENLPPLKKRKLIKNHKKRRMK